MSHARIYRLLGLCLGLCGCVAAAPFEDGTGLRGQIAPNIAEVQRGAGPPDARPDACYGLQVTPAVIETVTEQITTRPAITDAQGAVLRPARFRTETRQVIVEERRERWFETICDVEKDAAFISALQRALQARGKYSGAITGEMDAPTKAAIRSYQRDQGLDSPILSLPAARQLGLSFWYPELLEGRAEATP
ncbi:peptidoglycan-binding protein [Rhodobacteraceae bacterium XHP0102]|nr:peptidoglycan-binding protein [Rhodobacteraceae bacterium XHP0102]